MIVHSNSLAIQNSLHGLFVLKVTLQSGEALTHKVILHD